MLKAAVVILVATWLLGAAGLTEPEKLTPEQIRQAKLEFSAQKSRQRSNSRAQKKFIKAQRKAWKRSLKPARSRTRAAH